MFLKKECENKELAGFIFAPFPHGQSKPLAHFPNKIMDLHRGVKRFVTVTMSLAIAGCCVFLLSKQR